MSHSIPDTGLTCLRRALALRAARAPSPGRPLVLAVAGGAGALLTTRGCRGLVSVLDPRAVTSRDWLRAWLERRQAGRSALLLVPDRATGMRFAGRWRLNLARIRTVPDLDHPPVELVRRWLGDMSASAAAGRPWHAA
jgi:hypothetical protein